MEKTLPEKIILEKIDKRKEKLGLLYSRQQSWNTKQAITLKYLITYSNLRTYINPNNVNLTLHAWLACM